MSKQVDTEHITQTEHGFKWGAAEIECYFSDQKLGRVCIGLKTPKGDFQLHVSKTGKVRIFDKDGVEWKAEKKA